VQGWPAALQITDQYGESTGELLRGALDEGGFKPHQDRLRYSALRKMLPIECVRKGSGPGQDKATDDEVQRAFDWARCVLQKADLIESG